VLVADKEKQSVRVRAMLVALFVMVIVAPGGTAPDESMTVPVTVPAGACADTSRNMPQNRHTKNTADRLYMELPPFFWDNGANLLLSPPRSQRVATMSYILVMRFTLQDDLRGAGFFPAAKGNKS
jgi:hypothetical protein